LTVAQNALASVQNIDFASLLSLSVCDMSENQARVVDGDARS
jgi:hypothetical protein